MPARLRPVLRTFDVLEQRTLLSVTVPEVETSLGQLGSVVNHVIGGVNLLGKVPFLKGLSSALSGGVQNVQTAVSTVISEFEQAVGSSATAQAFLTADPTFSAAGGTLSISNVQANGSDAYEFLIDLTPKPMTTSLTVSGGQSFGLFTGLNLGSFAFTVSNQVEVRAEIEIDSSGDLLFERSSQTEIIDTPTIGLGSPLTVTGSIPAPGGSLQVTGYVGGTSGLSLSPQFTVGFGTTNDFVSLGTILSSATPSISAGTTINIPFGVGLSLNSGDSNNDQLPPIVYQKTYEFDPVSGSLSPSQGEILANGKVVATELNGQTESVNTGVLAGAVLHDIAGPIFDKYESYIPKDVSDFFLGNTQVLGQPIKDFLFGETPLDLAALAVSGTPGASAAINALQYMLEVGQYGTMLDSLNLNSSSIQSVAESDASETEDNTGIKYNILDDPVGTILSILSGQPANLVTWNIDAVKIGIKAAASYLGLGEDPATLAGITEGLIVAGLVRPIGSNPVISLSQIQTDLTQGISLPLEIDIDSASISKGLQGLVDSLSPVLGKVGLGNVLSDIDQVFNKINSLVNFSFVFFGDATLGVNSSFLTQPTAQGVLSSLFISAPGMNGPGTFGSLMHLELHAGLNIDLPQDLTGPLLLPAIGPVVPSYSLGGVSISASNGTLTASAGGYSTSVGGPVGQLASDAAGAFPGGAQAVADNLFDAVTDPAGTLNALINKLGSLSLKVNFDVNSLDVTIPAGPDASTPTELTAAEIAQTPAQCILTFKADATLDIEGSLSAIGHSVLSGGTGKIHLLDFCTQCSDNPYLAAADDNPTYEAFASEVEPGVVNVLGTAGDDVIHIGPGPYGGVAITDNGDELTFPSGLTSIWVYLDGESDSINGGNDSVSVASNLSSTIMVYIFGGSGTNVFTARDSSGAEFAGPIQFDGGSGDNTIFGGAGDSILVSNGGTGSVNYLYGGSGNVTEYDDGAGTNTLVGGTGDSYLWGGLGSDTLIAGDGYSELIGGIVEYDGSVVGGGTNILRGPSDAAGVNSHGVMVGGFGNTIINVGTVSKGSWILIGGVLNYQNAPPIPPDTGNKLIIGGQGNSTIIAGDAYQDSSDNYHPIGGTGVPSAIFGGPGNDTIYGGTGGDFIASGWLGSDIPAGNDTIYAGTSNKTWAQVAGLSAARDAMSTATGTDGTIYAIGGIVASTDAVTGEVDAFNPSTGVWTQKASLPTGRYTTAAATASNGIIYVMGGDNGYGLTRETDAYYPAANSWYTVANMPTNRSLMAGASSGGLIYAIGGINASYQITSEVDVYNPSTNSWSYAAPLPTAREGLGATTGPGGLIYAIGGWFNNYSSVSSEVDVYNPATNTWTQLASLPDARANLIVAAGADGRIYAIGGSTGSSASSEVDAYNPATNTWSVLPGLPKALDNAAGAVGLDGKIYAIGGYNGSSVTAAVETFDTNSDSVVVGNVSQSTAGGPLVASNTLPPGVSTQGVTGLTSTAVTISAQVFSEGDATTAWFVYGTSAGMKTTPAQAIGNGLGGVTISASLSGLAPNTPYEYYVVATSSNGTSESPISTFTTSVARLQFSQSSFTANVSAGKVSVTLTRTGDLSNAVSAVVSSGGGSAFGAFQQTVTFAAGSAVATLLIPITNNGLPGLPDVSTLISLAAVGPAAVGGTILSAAVVVHDNNTIPPVVTISSVQTGTVRVVTRKGKKLTTKTQNVIEVFLSGALSDPGNLGAYTLLSGKTKKRVTTFSKRVPLATATYTPSLFEVTLAPAGKLAFNQPLELSVNAAALNDPYGRLLNGGKSVVVRII